MPNGGDLASRIKGMGLWDLQQFKKQLRQRLSQASPTERESLLSEIQRVPQLLDVLRETAPAPPSWYPKKEYEAPAQRYEAPTAAPAETDMPLWMKGLERVEDVFSWMGMPVARTFIETPEMQEAESLRFQEEIKRQAELPFGERLKAAVSPPDVSYLQRGGELRERYEELPWYAKLAAETPGLIATGGVTATGFRAGLVGAARQAGAKGVAPKVARAALKPAEMVEKGVSYLPTKAAQKIGEKLAPKLGPITEVQKSKIFTLGKQKLIISEQLKPKPQFRNLIIGLTGQHGTKLSTKSLLANLTEGEAKLVIDALTRLEIKFGKPPKIPTTVGLITDEFAKKIPLLQEIGIKEKVRPTRQVFEKMGLRKEVWEPAFEAEVKIYEANVAFRKELDPIVKFVGRGSERDIRLFNAIENPKLLTTLTDEEVKIAKWGKAFYDNWADMLKLPAEKRRQNYITHIFEAEIQRILQAKNPLDPELIKAFDFIAPKTIFMPYLEKRLGQKIGLKTSFVDALNAYEARALKVFHYEPLIQKIRVFEKYLQPNSAKYLRDFTTRITGRPLTIDKELNQTIAEFAKSIEKLPGGKELAASLTRGNVGGQAAYNYTSLLYFLWLGFKPTSAIRNLGQHVLALSEVGPMNFAKGLSLRATSEGKAALKECLVLRSRSQALLPGIDTSFANRWGDKIREVSLKMFRWADRQNVSDSFLSGYAEAKALYPKAPRSMWIARGNEVAADTQYIYTKLGGASWSQSAIGRTLSPLTTWPENWLELISKWVAGRTPYVFREYAEATGTKLIEPTSALLKRKSMLLYLTLVGAAYAAEHKTKFRASEYTGWTSMRYLVNIAKGELPALSLPGAFAELIGGALTNNTGMIKSGWARIRPDNVMGIVNQFKKVAQGKTDWLSLFIYVNPDETPEQRRRREYTEIEDAIWAQYPSELKKLSDEIKELEKTDPRKARELLSKNHTILFARRQVALGKQQLRTQEQRQEQLKLMQGGD